VGFRTPPYDQSVNRIALSLVAAAAAVTGTCLPSRTIVGGAPIAPDTFAIDADTVVGPHDYQRGYPAIDDGGAVHAVIEIPAGTTAKFEVLASHGVLVWQRDREHDARREIDYLPFPVNYGMVPSTHADDGDALDILVLGRGMERGHVAKTRVIGVLLMGDDDERDDKLIAVPVEPDLANGFTRLHDLPELDEHYPAARTILETWFSYYWGEGRTHVIGWGDAEQAREILERARDARPAGAAPRPPAPRPCSAPARGARALRRVEPRASAC
jgi:inorganic pyrophosphatase